MSDGTLIGIDQLVLGAATSCDLTNLDGTVAVSAGTPITPLLIKNLKSAGVIGLVADKPDCFNHTLAPRRPSLEIIASRISEMRMRSGITSPLAESTANQVLGTLAMCYKALSRGKNPHLDAVIETIDLIIHDLELCDSCPVCGTDYKNLNLLDRLLYDAVNMGVMLGWYMRMADFPIDEIRAGILGGLLHDVGMLQVPSVLVNRAAVLTEQQLMEIRRHPYLGVRALSPFRELIPQTSMDIVLLHHERDDGNGYPLRRAGDKIPRAAAIAHIVDSFHALISHRPHRPGFTSHQAIDILMRDSGRSYNRDELKLLIKKIGRYPIGSAVILSSNEIGVVIDQADKSPYKPVIDVYFSSQHQFSQTPRRMNLSRESATYIKQVVK